MTRGKDAAAGVQYFKRIVRARLAYLKNLDGLSVRQLQQGLFPAIV